MKTILKGIVGSHLHGTATLESDTDYRGIFIIDPIEIISPFRKQQANSWIEGSDDNTMYELTHFCKMATQGNPSALEVLVSKDIEATPEGEELVRMLPHFISKKRCFDAFMGYSKNQEKKFRDPKHGNGKGRDVAGDNRKYKYACAHVRTLYQLMNLLKRGKLSGTYPAGTTDELKLIKAGRKSDGDIMNRIFQLEERCEEYYKTCTLPEEPNIEAIEDFISSVYLD